MRHPLLRICALRTFRNLPIKELLGLYLANILVSCYESRVATQKPTKIQAVHTLDLNVPFLESQSLGEQTEALDNA